MNEKDKTKASCQDIRLLVSAIETLMQTQTNTDEIVLKHFKLIQEIAEQAADQSFKLVCPHTEMGRDGKVSLRIDGAAATLRSSPIRAIKAIREVAIRDGLAPSKYFGEISSLRGAKEFIEDMRDRPGIVVGKILPFRFTLEEAYKAQEDLGNAGIITNLTARTPLE